MFAHVFSIFGVPDRILTDRGSHINSNMMKSLYGILGIEKLTTSAYRPSTNGRCERFHRFLNSALTFSCKKADQSDWDIAVPLKNWDDYETLTKYLTQKKNSRFKKTVTQHRFIHIQTNIMVDVIPCGEIGEPDQEIQWQDGHLMNIMGFVEAFENSSVKPIDGREFSVVDIPSLIILKFFAWNDNQKAKHWQDIDFILTNYDNVSIDNRIYEELSNELADSIIRYQDAGIYLIGKDIQKRLKAETLAKLKEILLILINNFSGYEDGRGEFSKKIIILQQAINS
jgi:predicted nucleotidyltransferase